LNRGVSRRIRLLELRAALAARDRSVSIRVRLVGPEGVTGVLLFETDKPTMEVLPTPDEVEEVRAAKIGLPSAFSELLHRNGDAHLKVIKEAAAKKKK
jgi:hypothetical protein